MYHRVHFSIEILTFQTPHFHFKHLSESTAKIKWRSLRDQFLKELKKVPVYTTGDSYYIEEREKPKWTHFNSLIFLLNTHTPRKRVIDIKPDSIIDISASVSDNGWDESKSQIEDISTTLETSEFADTCNQFPTIRKVYALNEEHENANESTPQCKSELAEVNACDEGSLEIEYDLPPFVAVAPQMVPPFVVVAPQMADPKYANSKRGHKRNAEEYDESAATQMRDELYNCPSKRVTTERGESVEPRTAPETNEDNENLLFFRSLLPYMNHLDIVQQLRVRMRFQEILMAELGTRHY